MRIISINLNGIRAAARKGFFEWLAEQNADIICMQETKAQVNVLQDERFFPEEYHCYFHDAEKKGYSGVGIYSRHEPQRVKFGLGWPVADGEGRYVQLDFDGLSVASLYMPSGSSGELRQAVKFDFLERYLPQLKKNAKKNFIICGDWNIAHKEIDLKNCKANRKNSGFLPEERAWMDTLIDEVGFVDAFREVNQQPDEYTWWSNRGQSWLKNVGWRLDYQMITPAIRDTVESVSIYKAQRFSDHAPLIIDYAMHFTECDAKE